MAEDDDNDGDDEREAPPPISRLDRTGGRRYRLLRRTRFRNRDRFPRLRKQLPIAELLGRLIEHHGLTDEVRKRCVCIYWPEIVGARIASKTFPIGFTEGTLQVAAISSTWVHELHFFKAQLTAKINAWVDANRVWLGPPPLVLDIRFTLAMKHREPFVDRDHVRRLRAYHARRMKQHEEVKPPTATAAECEAIRAETSVIVDTELRALIENVRVKWNR